VGVMNRLEMYMFTCSEDKCSCRSVYMCMLKDVDFHDAWEYVLRVRCGVTSPLDGVTHGDSIKPITLLV
jgi:hypothetical protein